MRTFKQHQGTAALLIAVIALIAAITGVAGASPSGPGATAAAARGPRGPRGFRGPAGFAKVKEVTSHKFTLSPGASNVNISDDAKCPKGWVVVGTGFDDGGVMTVGFVESFHTFVDGFVINHSSISASYEWQAICAKASSGSAAAADTDDQAAQADKLAAYRNLKG